MFRMLILLFAVGCQTHLVNQVDLWQTKDLALVQAIIEIPAGTRAKWEVDADSGELHWEIRDGKRRVIQSSFPYLANYGLLPQTYEDPELGGDGDPLDVMVLGEPISRGKTVTVRVIGVMRMMDWGQIDDKVLAVDPNNSRMGHITSLAQLNEEFPEVTKILQTWFSHYKKHGRVEILGWDSEEKAVTSIQHTHERFLLKKG